MPDILDDLDFGDITAEKPQDAAPTPGKRGPGRPAKNSASVPPKTVPMPKAGVIADQMSALYSFAAIPLMAVKPKTAVALMEQSDEIGKAWEQVAAANPKVRAALLGLAATSTWGALAMAHIPVVMALMSENEGQSASGKDAPVGEGSPAGRHAKQGAESPVGPVYQLFPMESGGARSDSGPSGER